MKIFISGASGLLGGNCLQYFKEKELDVVGSHFSFPTSHTVYFDTLNQYQPGSFDILNFKPDVIVHCGALTHVDYCEKNQNESYEKTVLSTQRLVETAKKCKAKFVFISTDYVFDGANGPYLEDARINPINIYGIHKSYAEALVLKEINDSLIIRITNVYGEEIRRKNFVSRIIEQYEQGKSLELILPYDQFATPTNAYDIARAIYLLVRDQKSGVYHIAGSDYMNRVTLASKVLSYLPGAKYELKALPTAALNQPAQRPLIGGLLSYKFLCEYPEFIFGTIDTYMQNFKSGEKSFVMAG